MIVDAGHGVHEIDDCVRIVSVWWRVHVARAGAIHIVPIAVKNVPTFAVRMLIIAKMVFRFGDNDETTRSILVEKVGRRREKSFIRPVVEKMR